MTWRARLRRFLAGRRVLLTVAPVQDVRREGSLFVCTGPTPLLQLWPLEGERFPHGWLHVRIAVDNACAPTLGMRLSVDTGEGFRRSDVLSPPRAHGVDTVIYLPPGVQRLRIAPGVTVAQRFAIGDVQVREISKFEALALAATHLAHPCAATRAWRVLRQHGVAGAVAHLQPRGAAEPSYAAWARRFDSLGGEDRAAIHKRCAEFVAPPHVTLALDARHAAPAAVQASVASVLRQLYPHWTLQVIGAQVAHDDPRVACVSATGQGFSSINEALDNATGDWVTWLTAGDRLAEHALFCLAAQTDSAWAAQVVYADDDVWDHGARCAPQFRPDYNPDWALSGALAGASFFIQQALWQQLHGFNTQLNTGHAHDLFLRATARLDAAAIVHIPRVLWHRTSTAAAACAQAVAAHLDRQNMAATVHAGRLPGVLRVDFVNTGAPRVSFIIPTRDRLDLLKRCIETLKAYTPMDGHEIIVVDNQSRKAATLRYFSQLQRQPHVRVLHYDKPFNYAAMNNMAAHQAQGDVLALLNNDLEFTSPTWLQQMLMHAVRPDVGAVGAKLFYPSGAVQHAGIVMGLGGVAAHLHRGCAAHDAGVGGRLQRVQNYSAVSAACLLVQRAHYLQVGGLDERLQVAFNDVDFCLRLQALGLRNVWTPYAEVTHHESATRQPDHAPARKKQFRAEIALMQARWPEVIALDPAYNANLSLHSDDGALATPPRAPPLW